MKTQLICGCCGCETTTSQFLFTQEEFARRKVFVKGSRPGVNFKVPVAFACPECNKTEDMNIFGTVHVYPIHMKFITRPSIVSNNLAFQNQLDKDSAL